MIQLDEQTATAWREGCRKPTRERETVEMESVEVESVVERFEELPEEKIEWLWPQRIAIGKLTLVVGDEGVGKSFLAADLAARVSSGMEWPGEDVEEGSENWEEGNGEEEVEGRENSSRGATRPRGGNVFFLGGNDAGADTMKPRMRRARADLKRVFVVNAMRERRAEGETVREVDLARDLETIERAIVAAGGCRLLILDPVNKFFKPRTSRYSPGTENVLRRLLELAAKHRFAVVAFTTKERTKVYRAFAAAARASFQLCTDAEDQRLRFWVPIKQDLSGEMGVMTYHFDGGKGEMPVMMWQSRPDRRPAAEILADMRYRRGMAAQRFEAEEFLKEELAYGERNSKEILEKAAELGLSTKTVRYVFRMAKGEPVKKGWNGGWYWDWPRGWPGKRQSVERREEWEVPMTEYPEGEVDMVEKESNLAGFYEDGQVGARVKDKEDEGSFNHEKHELHDRTGEGKWCEELQGES